MPPQLAQVLSGPVGDSALNPPSPVGLNRVYLHETDELRVILSRSGEHAEPAGQHGNKKFD